MGHSYNHRKTLFRRQSHRKDSFRQMSQTSFTHWLHDANFIKVCDNFSSWLQCFFHESILRLKTRRKTSSKLDGCSSYINIGYSMAWKYLLSEPQSSSSVLLSSFWLFALVLVIRKQGLSNFASTMVPSFFLLLIQKKEVWTDVDVATVTGLYLRQKCPMPSLSSRKSTRHPQMPDFRFPHQLLFDRNTRGSTKNFTVSYKAW